MNNINSNNSIEDRIKAAQKALENAEKEKTIAETRLESANAEKKKIAEEMALLGVTPDNIDEAIDELSNEIISMLDEVEAIISGSDEHIFFENNSAKSDKTVL